MKISSKINKIYNISDVYVYITSYAITDDELLLERYRDDLNIKYSIYKSIRTGKIVKCLLENRNEFEKITL